MVDEEEQWVVEVMANRAIDCLKRAGIPPEMGIFTDIEGACFYAQNAAEEAMEGLGYDWRMVDASVYREAAQSVIRVVVAFMDAPGSNPLNGWGRKRGWAAMRQLFIIHAETMMWRVTSREFPKEGMTPPVTDPNRAGKDGRTALFYATSAEQAALLIAMGADVNAETKADEFSRGGDTPLMRAAAIGNPGLVSLLLNHGADPNAKSRGLEDQPGGEWTALHCLAMSGAEVAPVAGINIVYYLKEAGADMSPADGTGETPLHLAVRNGVHWEIVDWLIKQGANVHACNVSWLGGGAPLHEIGKATYQPGTVSTLVGHGADVNARDKNGETPLHRLVTLCYPFSDHAALEALIKAGADVNAVDNKGLSVLAAARRRLGGDAPQALIDAGAVENP